jgi:hypothetical protein
MHLLKTLYVVILFVLLTPGVLLRLPPKGSLLTVAIVHGLVFALIYHFTHRIVYTISLDGFEDAEPEMKKPEEKKPEMFSMYK